MKTLLIIFFLLPILLFSQTKHQRTVAVTIDDLPYTGGDANLTAATDATEKMLNALVAFKVIASGFVTGKNVLIDGETDARINLLRQWRDSGMRLENHSFSHRSFNKLPLAAYLDDAVQGSLFPELVMRETGDSMTFFRHPFNHTGPDAAAKAAFAEFLAERRLQLAPFTIEHADYLFNKLYVDAFLRADSAEMKKIGAAYIVQTDIAFAFGEHLSQETFGREIAQIFLIHTNLINAEYLPDMLARIQARGYKFVSLSEAMTDSAYAAPEVYVGKFGISWLHRWRVGLEMENRLRDEPDPPKWAIDRYRELSQ